MLSSKVVTLINVVTFLLFAGLVFMQYAEAETYGLTLMDAFGG